MLIPIHSYPRIEAELRLDNDHVIIDRALFDLMRQTFPGGIPERLMQRVPEPSWRRIHPSNVDVVPAWTPGGVTYNETPPGESGYAFGRRRIADLVRRDSYRATKEWVAGIGREKKKEVMRVIRD